MKYYVIYKILKDNWLVAYSNFPTLLEANQWIFNHEKACDVKDIIGPLKLVYK